MTTTIILKYLYFSQNVESVSPIFGLTTQTFFFFFFLSLCWDNTLLSMDTLNISKFFVYGDFYILMKINRWF